MFSQFPAGRGQWAPRASPTRKKGRRAFRALLFEEFEDRRLLDAGLVGEIRNQLAGNFSPLNTALRAALTSRELPLIGSALGTRFDPLGAFATPLSQLPASPGNIVALSQALDAIAGIDVINPPTQATDPAQLRLRLTQQASITVPLANSFGPLHLDLGGAVDVLVAFDFQFTVAALYTGANDTLPVAYIDPANDQLTVSATITASNVNATARLGFTDISVTNGGAQLAGSVAVGLADPGSGAEADGRIKFSELSGSVGTPQAQATSGPALEMDIASSLVTGTKHLALTWSNANDASSVTSNLALLGAYSGLEQLSASVFADGLASLADWFGAIGGSQNLLGRPLPIVGLQLESALDLDGLFKNRLVDQVGAYSSAQALRSRLSSVGGLSNVVTQLVGNELTYSLSLSSQISRGVNLDLGMDDLLDLELDADILNLQANIASTLTFGVDLTTQTFFLADDGAQPELRVNAAIDVSGLAAAAHVGFLSVNVIGGTIHFAANATFNATDPGGDHRIAASDLAGGASTIGSFVDMALAGSANAQMTVDAPLLNIAGRQLTADWPDINDPASFTTNAAEFADLNSYKTLAATQFSFGIKQLADSLVAFVEEPLLGTSPLHTPLPLVKKSIAELIDLEALLRDQITKYTDVVLDEVTGALSEPFKTSQQLLQKLNRPQDGSTATNEVENHDLKYRWQLDKTVQRTVPFQFDDCSSDVCNSIDLTVTGSITVNLAAHIDFTFGVNKDTRIFFVETAAGPEFTTDTTVALNLDSAARLGFLGLTVAGAIATLNTHLALDVLDTGTDDAPLVVPIFNFDVPASPGKLTATELLVSPVTAIAQADFSGTASATLPLTASLGNYTQSATLRATWADVKQPCTIVLNTSEIQDLLRFQSITPSTIVDGLKELPGMLRTVAGTAGLARNLPVLGTNAQNLITLADQLDQLLATLTHFDTAQNLEQALESKLAPILSPANIEVQVASDVRFVLQLHQDINAPALGFNINEQIGGVGVQTSGQVAATGSVDIGLTLGVAFNCNIAANERFYVVTGTNPAAPVSQARLNLGIQTTTPFSATATLGQLLVGVAGGSIALSSTGSAQPATLAVGLKDPQTTPDGKLTLKEIRELTAQGQLTNVLASPTTNGKLRAVLPIDIPPPPDAGPLVITADWQWQNLSELSNPPTIAAPELPKYLALAQQFDIDTVIYGLQLLVTMFERLRSNPVMNSRLPLVNKTPADLVPFVEQAVDFLTQVRNGTSSSTDGPGFHTLLNQVAQQAGVGDFIEVEPGANNNPLLGQLHYIVNFHYVPTINPVNFDLGLGNSNLLNLNTQLSPTASFDATLEFGLNALQGFYLIDRPGTTPEIRVHAELDPPPIHAAGKIGPLQLNYGVDGGTADLTADFNVNLVSLQGPGGAIPISRLVSNFQDVVKPVALGVAELTLPFGLRIGDDGPGVIADFNAYWTTSNPSKLCFGIYNPANPFPGFCPTSPLEGFSHVKFELGEWLGKIAGPVLEKIELYNPLPRELIDVMLRPLPVLDVTPLDVLLTLGDLPKEIKLVFEIAQIIDQFSVDLGIDAALELDLSSFVNVPQPPPVNRSNGSEDGGIAAGKKTIWQRLRDDYDLSFPMFENFGSSIVQTIMGQPVDLILWDPPAFSKEKTYNIEFPIATYGIPMLADVTASGYISGGFGIFADLAIGLSTRGLLPHKVNDSPVQKLIDGLFLGDNKPTPNGDDDFEIGFFSQVTVGISGTARVLGFDAAKISGGGGVKGTIGLDLADLLFHANGDPQRIGRQDNGGDNHIYLDEINTLLTVCAKECVLTLGGELEAVLEVRVKALCAPLGGPCVLDKSDEVTFPIADWEIPCDDPEEAIFANVQGNVLAMIADPYPSVGQTYRNPPLGTPGNYVQGTVAEVSSEGLITLDPATRYIATIDPNSQQTTYIPTPTSEPVVVADPKLSQNSRTSIFIHYNTDNQPSDLRIQRVRNDVLSYQDIPLTSLTGVNTLAVEGTVGHDTIRIDPRVTELIPSLTHITVNSGYGGDYIDFGLIDPALSHLTSTMIDAGSGDDQVLGTFTTDVILGGRGNDQLSGEDGNDEIHGGSGDDEISGGKGNDTLYGNGGADNLLGQLGDNRLIGGGGDDTIVGSDGHDTIEGDGNDPLFPDAGTPGLDFGGDDFIIAGAGNDVVRGNAGSDSIYGGAGIDFLYGEGGSDEIHGDDGDDYIEADEPYALTFFNGVGDDKTYGGEGFDVLIQFANADQTLTDTAIAGQGSDTWSGVEQIRLTAGNGDNQFDVGGFTGTAFLDGGNGSDRIVSTRDFDITLSDWNLTRSDGASLNLSSIETATLTGGSGDNRFDVTRWTGPASLAGGGGLDTIYSRNDANFTISDVSLTRSSGGSFTLAGIQRAELSGGISNNVIDASAYNGTAILAGDEGDDTLRGGSGDDDLDGGLGADALFGNAGRDNLVAGGGAGDALDGGDGDDILIGSDDGADILRGAAGRDRLLGHGGNDRLFGGPGDDILDGGPGDDTLSGDAGGDLAIGGGGHDTLYGQNAANSDADSAPDFLYGDFGTNAGEAGSGRDRLFGHGGNDRIFGEGDDDLLDGGTGTDDRLDYGAGESAVPADFVPPTPTPDPTPQTATGIREAAGSLSVGILEPGRWSELFGSASSLGLSGDPGQSIEPAIVADATGPLVVWSDNRNGNFEIYLARQTHTGWQELAGSAHDGGISATAGASQRPSIALDSAGNAIVAWTEVNGTSSDIHVAQYDPVANGGAGGWVALGSSLTAGGISGTGAADNSRVVMTSSGPVLAWLDRSSGVTNVYVRQFSGGQWAPLGTDSASSGGVSLSTSDVSDLTFATDGVKVAAAWRQAVGGAGEIYLREFSGGSWQAMAGSASGGGISNGAGNSAAPSLAYLTGLLFAAWQDDTSGRAEIYAARFNGTSWAAAGNGAAGGGGVSNTRGAATRPQLAVGGGKLKVLWTDDRVANLTGNSASLFAKTWNGTAFIEELKGDASGSGISASGGLIQAAAVTVDPAGHPFVAWQDLFAGQPEIYVRGNRFDVAQVYYVNDDTPVGDAFTTASGAVNNSGLTSSLPKPSVQAILDAYTLGPGDVILVDAGSYEVGFTLMGTDPGVHILGTQQLTSVIQGTVLLDGVTNATISRLSLARATTVRASNRAALTHSVLGGLTIDGGIDTAIAHNRIVTAGTAVRLTGGTAGPTIESNTILAGSVGLARGGLSRPLPATIFSAQGIVIAGAASNVWLRGNQISGVGTGISLNVAADGRIEDNDIAATGTGIKIAAPFSGPIRGNDISGADVGVEYAAAAELIANRIHDNETGVVSTVAGNVSGLGFVGSGPANEIFANTTGVQLTGQMQGQHVYANVTGVSGSGILGGSDLDHANLIERNTTGVSFVGRVAFNRIARNNIGISAANQLIDHNLIYRNTAAGIQAGGNTRLINNTFYTSQGSNLEVHSASVEVENNVFWADGGYDLKISGDVRGSFHSDFNNLYAEGTGVPVHWVKDFADVLDWQADVARWDLHSTGRTAVNPQWAQPRFMNVAGNDFRVFELTAGLRFSSPTLDAGDARLDLALPPGEQNLLANPSFESGLSGWTTSAGAAPVNSSPGAFGGSAYFSAGAPVLGFAEQTLELTSQFTTAELDAQDLVAVFGGRVRAADESPRDRGRIIVTFQDTAAQPLSQTVVTAANTSGRWELIGDRITLPVGTRKISYRFETARNSGGTNDAYLDGAFVFVRPEAAAPDLGAYGSSAADRDAPLPHLALRTPDLYVDWERDKPQTIRWESFGNAADGSVKIDLLADSPDGPRLVTTLAATAPDSGQFTWTPANFDIDYGTPGLRIEISLAGNSAVFDRSAETFTVPENTNTFYVNDPSTANDEYTSAVGGNRNTGKVPTAPKPYPNNILRTYALGANQTLHVDTGDYLLFDSVVLSGTSGVADDEGFKLTGPGTATRIATLRLAFAASTTPIIDLNDADLMTVAHLHLPDAQHGLLAHSNSVSLTVSHLTITGSTLDGLRIDTGSSATTLDHLTVANSGRYGIFADGAVGSLISSDISRSAAVGVLLSNSAGTLVDQVISRDNTGDGFGLFNVGPARVERSQSFGNRARGMNISSGGPVVIGGSDLALGLGNLIHDNTLNGIDASGDVLIAGNVVHGHTNVGAAGINVFGGGQVTQNVVHDNYQGIVAGGTFSTAQVANNRVYHNTTSGIVLFLSSVAQGNVVYSNATGIQSGVGGYGNGSQILGNLIYDNTSHGIWFIPTYGSTGASVRNNTVYQPQGDAIRLDSDSQNLNVRNNILAVGAGYALRATAQNHPGFASDHNDFFVTGSGKVALWQSLDRPTLIAWQNTAFTDQNSLAQNPLFVDFDGADNVLGYASPTADGRDDDFHLQSLYGSFHGGALAPVISATTGLPVLPAPTEALDANQSPLIDRGNAADLFGSEPIPNGGYINIGAYGNTAQASKSPAEYVLVTRPDGGESWPVGRTFPIRWRSQIAGDQGTALQFDGIDDSVSFGNLGSRSAQGTIEFWMLASVVENYRNVFTTGHLAADGSGNRAIRFEEYSTGQFAVVIGSDNADGSGGFGGGLYTSALAANRWYHVAVVWDSDQNRIIGYLDGVQAFDLPNTTWPSQFPNVTAGVGWSTSRHWKGNIDELRIWTVARTAAEIQANMEASSLGNPAGLLARWRFNEGQGLVTADATGQFPGSLGGGVAANVPAWTSSFVPQGTVNIDLLSGSQVVSRLATATPNDGEFVWTLPDTLTPGSNYSILVTRTEIALADASNAPFTISPPIDTYYVNDGTVNASGDWTTAVGDDANDGLSPATPKASVRAVLEAYDLGDDDTILVDAGTYNLSSNLIITSGDSGVRIEGYHDPAFPTRAAVLNRGNQAGGNYVFELQNADDVTLSNLKITGGNVGVFTENGSDSDRLTVEACEIYGNSGIGIWLHNSNDDAVLTANRLHHQHTGVQVQGPAATITGNTVYAHDRGFNLGGPVTVTNNEVYDNSTGITGNGPSPTARLVISGNTVHDNTGTGIGAGDHTLIVGNTVYNQKTHGGSAGISVFGLVEVRNNTVYDNYLGISAGQATQVIGNRVFNNTTYGIAVYLYSVARDNIVYSNATGIQSGGGGYGNASQTYNNLVYANTTHGIWFLGGADVKVVNNTVYQPQGDAIRLEGDSTNLTIRNNIFSVGSGYVLRAEAKNHPGLVSDYNVLHTTGTGKLARWQDRDFTSRVDWFYELGFDAHSLIADPLFVNPAGADGLLGYASAADHGQDDDFHLLPISPAIDAGNPADLFFLEPLPSGDRINIGSYGNTSQATTSAAQLVQILAPNGLEKFEVGQQVNVQWRSAGLTPSRSVLLINAAGPAVGNWRASSFQTSINRVGSTTDPRDVLLTDPIDLSGIVDPAPEAIYQSYTWGNGLPGSSIAYHAPVPDGNYSVRLHFADPTFSAAGSRQFDIFLQGALASDNFDVAAAAGGRFKAVAPSFNVVASGGAGIMVELVNVLANCFINGIEITQLNPAGVVSPTVNLDLSTDSGLNWTTIASDLTLDGRGQGSYLWTAGPEISGNSALFRVRATGGSQPQDVSDAPFLVANSGQHYYVNDSALAGDVFTTAIGDNANSGKRPDSPMASLAALLFAYDLDPGDVIHVDTGIYNLVRNIVISTQDQGLKIEGPATAAAVLNRGNQAGGNYVFELQNADDVTLSNLKITGGNVGVFTENGSDSDRLTVEACEIYGNSGIGIWLHNSNDDAVLTANRLHHQHTGVQVQGPAATITGNTVYAHDRGFNLGGPVTVTNNEVYDNSTGITGNGPSPTARLVISGNTVHDNTGTGIGAGDHTLIVGNTVYNQKTHGGSAGISVFGLVEVRNNTVYDNYLGISAGQATQVIGNRVFNNTTYGIAVYLYSVARDNIVYSNATGIQSGAGGYGNVSQIYNNLVYANTDHGIWFIPTYGSGGVNVVNNTVYQPQGDAVRLDSDSTNLTIRNNIFSVGSGYVLRAEAKNHPGLVSDYNVLHTTGGGKLARWQDRDFTSRVDWFYELGFDAHSSTADPLFVNAAGADGLLGYSASANHGQDDDFHLLPISPAIDAGSPADPFLREPSPSGDRVNIGNFGNTPEATTSPAQTVQVLSPNGLEKYEVGQQVLVQWRSSGLTPSRPVVFINAGGPAVQHWSADSFQTVVGTTGTTSEPIDISGVANPAPAAVYQSFAHASNSPGNRLAYQLPVSDGNYQLRLHFVEPGATAAGQRVVDVFLQGALVGDDYDVFVDAGGRFRATTESFAVTATGGSGVSIELVNVSFSGAILSGIELTALNPSGMASAQVDLDLSTDSGQTWSNVASGLPLDHFGQGSYLWTASPETSGNTALFRVRATAGSQPQDVSDAPFLIANSGQDYYVNDGSLAGDVFTTANGDNANSGKTPSSPMASLAALLSAYDLDPGDRVHVDTGNYSLVRNIVISTQDQGLKIEGPATAAAVLNRRNQGGGNFVFDLQNADDVTLSNLSITGGNVGVYAANGSDSDHLTVIDNDIYGNLAMGISIEPTNEHAVISGNLVRDEPIYYGVGIVVGAADVLVEHNVIRAVADRGIVAFGRRVTISQNDVSGATTGISVGTDGGPGDRITVIGNTVHENSRTGISANENVLITGNHVFGHQLEGTATGIFVFGTSHTLGNTVHNNRYGITSSSRATGNRVFDNSVVGIHTGLSGVVDGNYVYSNPIGILSGIGGYYNSAQILNNLVYANTNQGILIGRTYTAEGVKIVNNTVYQPVGDAILLEGDTNNLLLRNNVLWIDTGYAVHATTSGQNNFDSDYNLIQQGPDPNAHVAFWNGANRHTLADWQAVTTDDAHSLSADAGFVDINGADNILGFDDDGLGYDGGRDDNFYARKNSNSIDRGDPVPAPATDIEGRPRSDDLGSPNLGPPGTFVDLGAFEFRGSSLDSTAPGVTGTLPDGIHAAGAAAGFGQFTITFSEGVNPIDAGARAAYELRGAGDNGNFNDGDDVIYVLTPQLAQSGEAVTLGVTVAGGLLPIGKYRFTAFSNSTTSIHDLAGLALDGNADGAELGNYIRIFNIAPSNQPPSFAPGINPSVSDESGPQVIAWATEISAGPPSEIGQFLQFIVQSNSNPGLFAVVPSIDATGTLRFTPKFNVSGSAQITVNLKDNGGTANGGSDSSQPLVFNINVIKDRVWHNAKKSLDVTGDGSIFAEDILEIVNFLNAFGSQPVPTDGRPTGPYYDCDGDGQVTASDALDVINLLNAFGPQTGAEGESQPDQRGDSSLIVTDTSLSSASAHHDDVLALLALDMIQLQLNRRNRR